MSIRVHSILKHMLEDALDAMKFVEEVGTVEDFSTKEEIGWYERYRSAWLSCNG